MVDDGRRWGFEEAGDWDFESDVHVSGDIGPEGVRRTHDDETLSGQDPDAVVTVLVDPDGAVLAVRLTAEWRRWVDPRGLPTSVVAAANTATMQALARQVELAPPTVEEPPPAAGAGTELAPIGRQDVDRLVDAVTADLEAFARRLSAVVDQPVSVESAGGHVSGTAQRGQVLQVSIDPNWAATVRNAEIESELVEVLQQLHIRSIPADLAAGPQSPAISELNALLADPRSLIRRLGLGTEEPND